MGVNMAPTAEIRGGMAIRCRFAVAEVRGALAAVMVYLGTALRVTNYLRGSVKCASRRFMPVKITIEARRRSK